MRFAAILLVVMTGSAFADEPKLTPLKPPAPDSLESLMREQAACTAFTNDCVICARAPDGPKCSTPGIACQPKEWRCTNVMNP
ncbi:hypothetical protein [Flaviflagellibacter deserti]|uniref:Uncharacterized protein n=1 Tax=Flaviflagellibacter deserti TaxID=2267266 RepID=A0ABV9Z640_9HYPH